MMRFATFPFVLSGIAALAGCVSTMSGLGGTDKYACKAPDGVLCTSVAGVYANSVQNNLPSQRIEKLPAMATPSTPPARTSVAPIPAIEGTALRSSPRILRMWLAPWEDSDGDLHDQSFLYVVVDSGRWLIEHQRSKLSNEFAPIAPPRQTSPAPAEQGANPERESKLPLRPAGAFTPISGGQTPSEEPPDDR